MRVLVIGASGVIGRRLVPQLIEAGHEVIGTSRSAEKAERLHAQGAHGVVLDALDAGAVRRAAARTPSGLGREGRKDGGGAESHAGGSRERSIAPHSRRDGAPVESDGRRAPQRHAPRALDDRLPGPQLRLDAGVSVGPGPAPAGQEPALFEGGHMPNQINDVIREILDWFDKFLGPIQAVTPNGTN